MFFHKPKDPLKLLKAEVMMHEGFLNMPELIIHCEYEPATEVVYELLACTGDTGDHLMFVNINGIGHYGLFSDKQQAVNPILERGGIRFKNPGGATQCHKFGNWGASRASYVNMFLKPEQWVFDFKTFKYENGIPVNQFIMPIDRATIEKLKPLLPEGTHLLVALNRSSNPNIKREPRVVLSYAADKVYWPEDPVKTKYFSQSYEIIEVL